MYVPALNAIVLEIPKCGSRTLYYSLRANYQECDKCAPGHLSISQVFKQTPVRENPKVVGVIREPKERFVSSWNYHIANKSSQDVNFSKRIDYILDPERPTPVVFKPQTSFLEDGGQDYRLRLFPFERLDLALKELGIEETPHHNKGKYKYSYEKLMRMLPKETWDMYEEDFELYERAVDGVH